MEHETKPNRRWRRKQLAEFWGVSDRTIDRMRKDGRLSEPMLIGARTVSPSSRKASTTSPMWSSKAAPFSVSAPRT
jgi:predicted DNA-binding transcriptional regulator AlpA